ncbi:MAG: elongation factor 4, partial [Armatimonadota bacterium]
YPVETSGYPDLRDALEKHALNDAAIQFEPESSVALGFGFRAGFLGLLHMEIAQERLEREYDRDLIATAPNVVYRVLTTEGEVVEVANPAEYPEPGAIEGTEEPYVRLAIFTPPEFVGPCMELCQSRRGIFKDHEYRTQRRAILRYELPLAEILLDFFDNLKSHSRGHASMDYEFIGYRDSDLVKIDVLINGDRVDPLAFISHKDFAQPRARGLVDRLKEVLPRQLFEIRIQAAIGSRIIASSRISALRKQVTAKCYGGDVTRKRKLLERQKEGKKRMKQIGTVEVPQEAFLSLLKVGEE